MVVEVAAVLVVRMDLLDLVERFRLVLRHELCHRSDLRDASTLLLVQRDSSVILSGATRVVKASTRVLARALCHFDPPGRAGVRVFQLLATRAESDRGDVSVPGSPLRSTDDTPA